MFGYDWCGSEFCGVAAVEVGGQEDPRKDAELKKPPQVWGGLLMLHQPDNKFKYKIKDCYTFMISSRTLQWVPTERDELYGGKIDEDNYRQKQT